MAVESQPAVSINSLRPFLLECNFWTKGISTVKSRVQGKVEGVALPSDATITNSIFMESCESRQAETLSETLEGEEVSAGGKSLRGMAGRSRGGARVDDDGESSGWEDDDVRPLLTRGCKAAMALSDVLRPYAFKVPLSILTKPPRHRALRDGIVEEGISGHGRMVCVWGEEIVSILALGLVIFIS